MLTENFSVSVFYYCASGCVCDCYLQFNRMFAKNANNISIFIIPKVRSTTQPKLNACIILAYGEKF